MEEIIIENKKIGGQNPTYFIADIAANHDGNLSRAIDLIHLAAESGANAAKFQHFAAETIVSDYGFKALGNKHSHQLKWKKSVYRVYQEASINLDWTPILFKECKKAGITFFTSPYSFAMVDAVDPYVSVYKIGSGDITWIEIIKYIANKGKPVILATGASITDEVCLAVDTILQINQNLMLLQCNTNYTASLENFRYINLNVLKTYNAMFPNLILGLSDHTPGHVTVLGAVALGARVIEKHFTDDTKRDGPDHGFSMDPKTWKEMVERTRELEAALGKGVKCVEENESETVILQRRSIRAKKTIKKDSIVNKDELICLRPCPDDGIPPHHISKIIGKKINRTIDAGDHLRLCDLK